MSNKVTVSTKVERPLKERLDEYAEKKDMKKSAVIRDLIKETVEEDTQKGSIRLPLPIYTAWCGSIAFAAGALNASDAVAITGGIVFGASLIYAFQAEDV